MERPDPDVASGPGVSLWDKGFGMDGEGFKVTLTAEAEVIRAEKGDE